MSGRQSQVAVIGSLLLLGSLGALRMGGRAVGGADAGDPSGCGGELPRVGPELAGDEEVETDEVGNSESGLVNACPANP